MKLEDQDWVINPNTGNKIDMKKLLTEQRLAIIYIDTHFPFFSTLLKNLTWIYTFQVPTQATDGTRLLVNPEFTSTLSIRKKDFDICGQTNMVSNPTQIQHRLLQANRSLHSPLLH